MNQPRQQRIRRIRRTVAAGSLATFAVAWGVIAGSGSMGAKSTATAAGSSTAASSSTYEQSDDDWGASTAQRQQQAQQQQLPDMTTRQS